MAFTFGGATYDDPPVDERRYRASPSGVSMMFSDRERVRQQMAAQLEQQRRGMEDQLRPPQQHPGLVDVDLTEPPPAAVIPYTRVLKQRIERLEAERAELAEENAWLRRQGGPWHSHDPLGQAHGPRAQKGADGLYWHAHNIGVDAHYGPPSPSAAMDCKD